MKLELRKPMYHSTGIYLTIPWRIRDKYGWSYKTSVVLVADGKHAFRMYGYNTLSEAITTTSHAFTFSSFVYVKPIPTPKAMRIRIPVALQKKIDWANPTYIIIDYSNPNHLNLKEHCLNDSTEQ